MSKSRNTIALSDYLGVTHETLDQHGVMDVLLGIDTKLFIDPKLLELSAVPELEGSDADIQTYFQELASIHRQSEHVPRLQEMAISRIAIKEPVGLSIGYGNSRDSGTAIPIPVAKQSLKSLSEMVYVGMDDMKVMQLLGLFIKGFGPDGISDLTAHIIYKRLCAFTQRVSKDLDVTTEPKMINGTTYHLPIHPSRKHHLIFVPNDVVRDLPLATNWDEVIEAARHNERLRDDFNVMVGRAVKSFVKNIKKNPSLLTTSQQSMKTLLGVYDDASVKPYDTSVDPSSHNRIVQFASKIEQSFAPSSTSVQTTSEVIKFVQDEVMEQYRRAIENTAGNTLLYRRKGKDAIDSTKPVKEDAAQTLFYIVADMLCAHNNVLLSREPNAGQGAVDFSLGKGYKEKVLVEIKKSNNTKLIAGYEKQLASYIENEKAAHGFYVVVVVKPVNLKSRTSQLNQLQRIYAEKMKRGESCPTLVVINGLIQLSPSKR